MATAIPIQIVDSFNGGSFEDVSFTGATVEGMTFVNNGNTLILIRNSSVNARNSVFTSIADPYGRTGDLTVLTTASGGDSVVGWFQKNLWNQPNGTVEIVIPFSGSLYFAAITGMK